MSITSAEIATQPATWREAVRRAGTASGVLPQRGERVAFVGCGTSWFIAQACAVARETAGAGESDAFAASEAPHDRPYDRIVAISRSGTTTEVQRYLADSARRAPALVITAVAGSPVAEAGDDVIVLEFADEESVVQTRFATTALSLLRAHLGEDIEAAAADAERVLAAPPALDLTAFDHFVFLGHGWTNGLASEAALKLREAANAWTEAHPALEYRHGPIAVATDRSLVWTFGTVDAGLVADVRRTGATVIQLGVDPAAELVGAQLLAVALAESRGLDPDNPRNLTRSVVLVDG
jgi:fructoselysine-6-P-deglycase FrlB-like protein